MELPGLFYRGEFIAFIILYVVWRIIRHRLRIANIPTRHIFITGCDSGFGRLLAERLHAKGVNVYAGCLLPRSVEELTRRYGPKMKPVLVDVTKSDSVRKARDFVREQLNGKALWALVNNAGISGMNLPFEWSSKEDCQKTLDVNLLGVYDVTLAFLPLIKREKKGRIINVASIFGRVGYLLSGYTLSKYGIEGFSDGLSIELHPYNITVHTIEPGNFRTTMVPSKEAFSAMARARWDQLDSSIKESHGEEFLEKVIEFFAGYTEKVLSPNIDLVVNAYMHAILAKYPKNRYPVGVDMKLFYQPMSWLPFSWQFRILLLLQRVSGIRKPIPNDAVKLQ